MSRILEFMSYSEYLQTDHWRETRAAAIKRTPFCALCPREEPPFEVHHRDYTRIGEELPEDLTVLCGLCHQTYELGREMLGLGAPITVVASCESNIFGARSAK